MLASIKADTSRIEKKIERLLEVLPEHVPDHIASMLLQLPDNIILVNGSSAVAACGTVDILWLSDLNAAFYDKIFAAARAFKTNLAHK